MHRAFATGIYMKTRIAIVEDDAGICEELKDIISQVPEISCVCVCRNVTSAVERIPTANPDVVVMDVRLPDGSGIECTARIKRALPDVKVLMFTIADDTDQIVKALEAGASGYILKDSAPEEILAAIRDIQDCGAPMSKEVARKLIASFHRPVVIHAPDEPLTPREEEILHSLGEGLLYKEIGEKLGITVGTVCTHIKNIYRKLHVRSRTEAVMKYCR